LHPFNYVAPVTVKEAIDILEKHGDRARPLAGGTDLLVQARGNKWDLDAVVDVKKIPEAMQLDVSNNGLTIGAGVPCYQIYDHEKIKSDYPGIVDGAFIIGGIQIQSRAAIGGNLCNAAPSGDAICPLIVYDATANIAGPSGNRDVSVEDFCVGPGKTVLKNGELLVSISVPKPPSGFGAAYERFIPRNEMDIAVAAVAVSVTLDNSGTNFESVRIALASVGPTPIFATKASNSLKGKSINESSISEAAAIAKDESSPISDMRGTIEHRKQLIEVITKRMLNEAVKRARG
jgi:carbon-monoxide dehydrogenase medium subunit